MKPWGLSKGGALVALLLIISGALLLPLSAEGQGKRIWGYVRMDCATPDPAFVPSDVTLVDVHAQVSDRVYDASSGYFEFFEEPGYYKLVADPKGFPAFTNETMPFRFDGRTSPRKDICVDRIPVVRDRNLNLTVLDAQPTYVPYELVSFVQTNHVGENVTLDYDDASKTVALDFRPLVNRTEVLTWRNTTGFTPVTGRVLTRGTHYDYDEDRAFNGRINITDPAIQSELFNALFGVYPQGWLIANYYSASTTSSLAHGHVTNVMLRKDATLMGDYSQTLTLDNRTGAINIIGNWSFGDDVLTASYDWSAALGGARVIIREQLHREAIGNSLVADPDGLVLAKVWQGGMFDVEESATGYSPAVSTYTIAGHVSDTIYLSRAMHVNVLIVDDDGPVSAGITALLINNDPGLSRDIRILRGTAAPGINIVTIPVYAGNWTLIADANGYLADTRTFTVSSNRTEDVTLVRSLEERYETTIGFIGGDWDTVRVWRNATLLADSEFPKIGYEGLRSLEWQLDFAFGDESGILSATELTTFQDGYLTASGPFYTTTDTVLTINGLTYMSKTGPGDITVSASRSGGNFTFRSDTRYELNDLTKPIAQGKPRYFVNVTTIADKNVTGYQNYTYFVSLPRGYEMTSKTTQGRVDTRNFTKVEVDPDIDATNPHPKANLIVDQSVNGVARAEVEGPVGKVFVKSNNQDSYLALVANNTAVVFSANKTTDRTGNQAVNAKDATFDWTFLYQSNSTLKGNATGIWTTFDFGSLGTNYSVNLTVTQVNPDNRTYRVINVSVDNLNPIAVIKTNRTEVDNPLFLPVNEDLVTRFNGENSTDLLWGTLSGELAEWNWDFDSDGTRDQTGKVVNQNYSKPGTFNATLWVVDRVGHRSANQTMNVTVLDTTPPVPHVAILEDVTWREPAQLSEDVVYWFNVSRTTDNSLNATVDNVNLTYTYDWGDGSNKTGRGTGLAFLNVTKTYLTYGDWKLSINVTDAAGNRGWLNRTLVVQADTTAHPDLAVIAGTLKISPASPEEGQLTTFRVNVTNGKDKVAAQDLKIQFALIVKGRDSNGTATSVRWLKADGTAATSIAPGENVTVEFKYAFPTLGNKTIKITVWDGQEPPKWIDDSNKITTSLVVREGGWKIWAWVGAFFFIIVGIPMIIWVVRKVRAGELHLPRRRPKEGEDEDEEDEEEDEDEEKEEKGGKKRL